MRVTFTKLPSGGIAWDAIRSDHTKVSLRVDARQRGLPHDLVHYVVEGALGMQHGFWGCIAAGGSLRITTASHRKGHGPRSGRGVLRMYASELGAAEDAIGRAVAARERREKTPTTHALDVMQREWNRVPLGGSLVLNWPPTARRFT
jgi:hypothetical protein